MSRSHPRGMEVNYSYSDGRNDFRVTEGSYYPQEDPIDWHLFWRAIQGETRLISRSRWPQGNRSWDWTMNQLWTVYGLHMPNEPIRYVGITRGNPAWRLQSHMHGQMTKAKREWLSRGKPIMEILTTLRGTLYDARAVELLLTRHFQRLGHSMINAESRSRLAA